MKKNRIFIYMGLILLSLSFFSLSSCKKSSSSTDDNETIANDNNLADNLSSDAQAVGDQAVNNQPTKALAEGATSDSSSSEATSITNSSSGSLVTIKVNYGDTTIGGSITVNFGTNTLCKDGRTRSGEVTVSWSGRYYAVGTIIHYYSTNYVVDDNSVSFSHTVTNLGHKADSVYTPIDGINPIKFSVTDTLTLTPSGSSSSFKWYANRTRILFYGWWKPYQFWNLVYAIRGGGSGVSTSGVAITHKILHDIIKPVITRHYVAGKLQIAKSNNDYTITIICGGNDGVLADWETPGISYLGDDPKLTITETNNSTNSVVKTYTNVPQK